MKCPICNGRGSVYNALGNFYEDCGHCQGTGTVRVEGEPMTNEEYLKSRNTEQLAEWISSVVKKAISIKESNGIVMLESAIWWDEWLKQKNTLPSK